MPLTRDTPDAGPPESPSPSTAAARCVELPRHQPGAVRGAAARRGPGDADPDAPEIRRFLDAAEEPVRTLIMCAVLPGARRGEFLGLRARTPILRAIASLIPFLIAESRTVGAPRALAARLLETNLRTYVRAAAGQTGIYFSSLDAPHACSTGSISQPRCRCGRKVPASCTHRGDPARAMLDARSPGGPPGVDVDIFCLERVTASPRP